MIWMTAKQGQLVIDMKVLVIGGTESEPSYDMEPQWTRLRS